MRRSAGRGWPEVRPESALTLAFVLLLAALLIGPLWQRGGVANTADGILHLHRSAEVARAWAQGVVWPRWFPSAYQGLGVPVFHYYSPLFYVLVAPLHLLGFPLDAAAKLIISVLFVVSGLAVHAWVRRLLSAPAGLVAAAFYLSGPHFFREYYFQGDYPQTIALFWFPVVLWAFTRLYEDGRWRNWVLAAASLAVLATAHNITAMLGGAFLVLYWLALLLRRRSWPGWWRGAGGAALGGALSAFFWLPALGDIPLVRVNTLRESFFHFSNYFVHPTDLLAAPPLLDSRAVNPPFPYLLGWAAWLALAAGAIVVLLPLFRRVRWGPAQAWAGAGLAITAIYLALTQSWSTPVWEHLPGLSMLQFPGRLLGPAAAGAALTAAAAGHACVQGRGVRRAPLCVAAAVLIVALSSSVFLFPPQPFLRITRLSEADTQAWERETGNWGTTSSNGYLPRWAAVPGAYAGQAVQAGVLPEGATWTWETPHRAVLRAATGAGLPAGPLTLPLHYFPAWRAAADGADLLTQPADGLLAVTLPGPAREIALTWGGTAWERRGEWISRIAVVVLLVGSAWAALRKRRGRFQNVAKHLERSCHGLAGHRTVLECSEHPERRAAAVRGPKSKGRLRAKTHPSTGDSPYLRLSRSPAQDARFSSAIHPLVPALALLALLIAARFAIAGSGVGWFQRTSPPGTVSAARNPLRVTLGGAEQPGVSLLGWELLPGSQPRPGGELRVRLYWQAEARMPRSLHSFAHLTTPALHRSWAIVQNDNPGRVPTFRWSPALYVVDDLALNLPPELPPIAYTLAVGLVDEDGQRLNVPGDPDGMVALQEITLAPLRAGKRQPLRPAVAAPAAFSADLRLQGYDLRPGSEGGQELWLYWETPQVTSGGAPRPDWVVFVHMVDAGNSLVAQFDGPPLDGLRPTSRWPAGALMIDRRMLRWPDGLPAGGYKLLVGLYDPSSMARAAVVPDTGAGDAYGPDNALVIPVEIR